MAEEKGKARAADARTPSTDEEKREESYTGPVSQGDGDEGTAEPQQGATLEDLALGERKRAPGG
jgi:hypothetical protein